MRLGGGIGECFSRLQQLPHLSSVQGQAKVEADGVREYTLSLTTSLPKQLREFLGQTDGEYHWAFALCDLKTYVWK